MQQRPPIDDHFCRLLHRGLLVRRAGRMVLIALAAVVVGLAVDVLLLDENGEEGFRLGTTTTGIVTAHKPTASQKRVWVEYSYTVKGVGYTDSDLASPGPSTPAVGETVEVMVSAFGPTITQLTRLDRPSLLSRVPWALAAIFLIWLIVGRIRAAFAPRNRRLRNTLAALASAPGEQADLREFYAFTPLMWRGWPPDSAIEKTMKAWLAKQPRDVPAAEMMALLHHADLLFHPEEYGFVPLPAQTPTAYPVAGDEWELERESAPGQGWRRLQEGTATAMALDLRNYDEEAHRLESYDRCQRFSGVLREIGLTTNGELWRRKCEEAGCPLNLPGTVPLRQFSGDGIVADDLISAPNAFSLIDSTMVRFGFLPQPGGLRRGQGWIETAQKAKRAVWVDYQPGVELRVSLGDAEVAPR